MNDNSSMHSLGRAMLLAACGLPAVATIPAVGASLPLAMPVAGPTIADVPVSGRVTQANGEGLPGVTVVVKGTTVGASTDMNGNFSLTAPEGSTLVFSNIGYKRVELPLTGTTTGLTVSMVEDTQALGEVVVVGYGTQERATVTGAVASVSGRDIAAQPVPDANQAIQGRAAGVTVTSNNGAPGGGGGVTVRVRGITSAGNNNPLYVVDGFPLPSSDDRNGGLSFLNPNDIESIDVLKDASATAIYGVRAANGVVIVTTKRGKAGKATINLDAYVGTQSVWRKLDLLNAEQYATLNNESRSAANTQGINSNPLPLNPRYTNPASLGQGTDWQDAIYRNAKIQSYNLSATGGNEKGRYALSAGYFQQDGTIIGSNFERFSLRANGDLQLGKFIKIGNSISLTHAQARQLDTNNDYTSPVFYALTAPPTRPVIDPVTGNYTEFSTETDYYLETNPVVQATRDNFKTITNRVLTNVFAEIEPVKGLRFRTNVGADLQFYQNNRFTPRVPGATRLQNANAQWDTSYNPSYLIENTLTYDKVFADKHSVTLLAGQSAQQFDYSTISASRQNYSRDDLQVIDVGPSNGLNNSGNAGQSRLASYFARANYDFAGKYLFSAVIRRDGSSAFARQNAFGYFPGISAGWRLSEEGFLQDVNWLSNLKIRAGWGRVGNPTNAGAFAYLQTITSNRNVQYALGSGDQTFVTGAAPTRAANENLKWENNEQTNVGIDVGLLDNRLEATLDLYTRTSPNLLINVPVSTLSGTYEDQIVNAAASRNRGLDFSFTSRNLVGEDGGLTWTTNLNFSLYRSELTSLGLGRPFNAQQFRGNASIVRYDKDVPFGSFYGYVADGLIQTDEELRSLNSNASTATNGASAYYQNSGTRPGDIRFRDLNGDGVITDADRTYIGDPNPDFTYGVTNTLSYKGIDVSVFLQGSQGNDVFNLNRFYTDGGLYGAENSSTRVLDRWTGPGTSNSVPRAVAGDPNQNLRFSSDYVQDGSYMRIKLLTVGYTLPKTLINRISAQNVRFYLSAQNLLTVTNYDGIEPEIAASNYVNGQFVTSLGIDRGSYPQSRTFIAGINIGF
ncbi:TonB-dependent receptor [Hymenobacter tibetensis]|uniref:TonB-dependent receptor n=1 Tax=Hymenobacter tibetensis TaxID=497967 RepID=A0ABY4CZC8_9BACT|nr:TonB-dependent receptor [Hymenobacter tibetensis]UOG75412.1 TonB-dependent receptor [Hymenobacter tibetensis]